MLKIEVSILLYAIAAILLVGASIFDNYELELLVKPVIIPSIFFAYFTFSKEKLNITFSLSLFFFFIGDMLFLIGGEEVYELSLFVFLIPYIFVLRFIWKDFRTLVKEVDKNIVDISFFLVLAVLTTLILLVLDFLEVRTKMEFLAYLLFGIELELIGLLTTIIHYNSANKKNFYLTLAVSTFIFSDLFFVLYKNFNEIKLFRITNVATQTLSYYFYLMYFVEREKTVKNLV